MPLHQRVKAVFGLIGFFATHVVSKRVGTEADGVEQDKEIGRIPDQRNDGGTGHNRCTARSPVLEEALFSGF